MTGLEPPVATNVRSNRYVICATTIALRLLYSQLIIEKDFCDIWYRLMFQEVKGSLPSSKILAGKLVNYTTFTKYWT